MRKWCVIILLSSRVWALPVGNPSEASLLSSGLCWENISDSCYEQICSCPSGYVKPGLYDSTSFRIGFYGDYVFQRNLKMQALKGHGYSYINQSQLFTNAGYLALNFYDRVDLFGTLGASRWNLAGNASAFNAEAGTFEEIYSDPGLSWSVGTRVTLWECTGTALGGEFQYFQFRTPIEYVSNSGFYDIGQDNGMSQYAEWQFGLGISHRFWEHVIPYAAVKWSSARLTLGDAIYENIALSTDAILTRAKTALLWGYAVGLSLTTCDRGALTVEGRFGDESAFYVNGQFRF